MRWVTSSKFLLTVSCLIAVFALVLMDKDVRSLEIIVPAILGFYQGANVLQEMARRKYTPRRRYDSSLSSEED